MASPPRAACRGAVGMFKKLNTLLPVWADPETAAKNAKQISDFFNGQLSPAKIIYFKA